MVTNILAGVIEKNSAVAEIQSVVLQKESTSYISGPSFLNSQDQSFFHVISTAIMVYLMTKPTAKTQRKQPLLSYFSYKSLGSFQESCDQHRVCLSVCSFSKAVCTQSLRESCAASALIIIYKSLQPLFFPLI